MKLNARNTAELLQIFRDENTFDNTLRKIKEFMEPKAFGSSLGDLIFKAYNPMKCELTGRLWKNYRRDRKRKCL